MTKIFYFQEEDARITASLKNALITRKVGYRENCICPTNLRPFLNVPCSPLQTALARALIMGKQAQKRKAKEIAFTFNSVYCYFYRCLRHGKLMIRKVNFFIMNVNYIIVLFYPLGGGA